MILRVGETCALQLEEVRRILFASIWIQTACLPRPVLYSSAYAINHRADNLHSWHYLLSTPLFLTKTRTWKIIVRNIQMFLIDRSSKWKSAQQRLSSEDICRHNQPFLKTCYRVSSAVNYLSRMTSGRCLFRDFEPGMPMLTRYLHNHVNKQFW